MKALLSDAASRRLTDLPVAVDLSDEVLLRELQEIALRARRPADRLRAIELLGRARGLFREEGPRGVTLEELVPRSTSRRPVTIAVDAHTEEPA